MSLSLKYGPHLPQLLVPCMLEFCSICYHSLTNVWPKLLSETAYLLGPAVAKIGWGEARLRKSGWKYSSEGRFSAIPLRCTSLKVMKCFLTYFLNLSFVRFASRIASGWGILYCRQRSLIWVNHELNEGLETVRVCIACLYKILSGSLQIIPNGQLTQMDQCLAPQATSKEQGDTLSHNSFHGMFMMKVNQINLTLF